MGRFPRGRSELPDEAVAFVARQVGVSPGELGFYEWSGGTIEYHRAQIRGAPGFPGVLGRGRGHADRRGWPCTWRRPSGAPSRSARSCWPAAGRADRAAERRPGRPDRAVGAAPGRGDAVPGGSPQAAGGGCRAGWTTLLGRRRRPDDDDDLEDRRSVLALIKSDAGQRQPGLDADRDRQAAGGPGGRPAGRPVRRRRAEGGRGLAGPGRGGVARRTCARIPNRCADAAGRAAALPANGRSPTRWSSC